MIPLGTKVVCQSKYGRHKVGDIGTITGELFFGTLYLVEWNNGIVAAVPAYVLVPQQELKAKFKRGPKLYKRRRKPK